MKKISFGILIGFLFVLGACSDDDAYTLNQYWLGFGVLQDDVSYKIKMDNGDILTPLAPNDPHSWYDYDYQHENHQIQVGDRMALNYTILGDDKNSDGEIVGYFVKINSTRKVLMKGILDVTTENQDSIGNDPIIVQDFWVTDSLLNFKLKYYGNCMIHFINLVKEPGEIIAADQPFELELRHNANGDAEDILFSAFVSFKLNDLKLPEMDSIQFRVTSTDYDGELFEYSGVYNYGENN